jgi:hypothetical protein
MISLTVCAQFYVDGNSRLEALLLSYNSLSFIEECHFTGSNLEFLLLPPTVVSGRLNVVKGLKRSNEIVTFGRNPHTTGLYTIPVRIYLARNHSLHRELTVVTIKKHTHMLI